MPFISRGGQVGLHKEASYAEAAKKRTNVLSFKYWTTEISKTAPSKMQLKIMISKRKVRKILKK